MKMDALEKRPPLGFSALVTQERVRGRLR